MIKSLYISIQINKLTQYKTIIEIFIFVSIKFPDKDYLIKVADYELILNNRMEEKIG